MPQRVADVMTADPYGVNTASSIQEAAQVMRDREIGDVMVMRDNGSVCGIVTDRDIVVRAVADGSGPQTPIEDICSHEVVSVPSDSPAAEAVALMRSHNIRRLPVIDDDQLVGIVSLGDLAIERDPESALADISKAPANN